MLNHDQLASFNRNGFLVVEDVLQEYDLRPLENEYQQLLNHYCQKLHQQGLVSKDVCSHNGSSFGEQFTKLMTQCPEYIDRFNISLPLVNGDIDPESYVAHTGPAVFGLLSHPKILDVVESVIGGEISSSPVQQMRLKPPQSQLTKSSVAHSGIGITTWHQDTVAVLPEALETNQVTVWVAVTDATENNGCLVSIPASHKDGALAHAPGLIPREPSISEALIGGRAGVPLPVKRGGIVIFHRNNIHCSLPNQSASLRWSVDIRYHPIGQPSGRPAFPGFIARSRLNPESELKDPSLWNEMWQKARADIISGEYKGQIFTDWK